MILLKIFACILIVIAIFAIMRFIYEKILCLCIIFLERKRSKIRYDTAKMAYDCIIFSRKEYYQTHFMNNEEKKERQAHIREMYDLSIKLLKDIDSEKEEIKKWLIQSEREELDRILALPRYNLL